MQFNSTTQFVNINRYPDYQNEYAQGASSNPNPLTLTPGNMRFSIPIVRQAGGPQLTGKT